MQRPIAFDCAALLALSGNVPSAVQTRAVRAFQNRALGVRSMGIGFVNFSVLVFCVSQFTFGMIGQLPVLSHLLYSQLAYSTTRAIRTQMCLAC